MNAHSRMRAAAACAKRPLPWARRAGRCPPWSPCVQPAAGRSHFGFIQLADEALYAAKERGRNCVVIMDKEYEQLSTGSFRKRDSDRRTAG